MLLKIREFWGVDGMAPATHPLRSLTKTQDYPFHYAPVRAHWALGDPKVDCHG
jgi:hypothetical protein